MEQTPEKIDENRVTIEIRNANLLNGTWITGGFFQGINDGSIKDLTVTKVMKGEHSIIYVILSTYFTSAEIQLIEQFVEGLVTGTALEFIINEKFRYSVLSPFKRIAKYIAKDRNAIISAKVNDKQILQAEMNKKIRNAFLKEDMDELEDKR